jgi:hypothetical protein
MILPISASQVARITDMSHWCPASFPFYMEGMKRVSTRKMSGVKNEAEGPGTMAHICNSSYLAG